MTNRDGKRRAGRVVPLVAAAMLLPAAAIAPACNGVVVTTIDPIPPPSAGQIGDPCQPGDERRSDFAGYQVPEESIANRFAACNSGVCLVNHVQGRADCPLGQEAPKHCAGAGDSSCGAGASCVPANDVRVGPYCDDGPAPQCGSGVCNTPHNACKCTSDDQCPDLTACNAATHECAMYVCHRPGDCQSADAPDAENAGKSCCVGESDVPVIAEVCGQCAKGSGRNAAEDTYCSCRCGLADGSPPDGSDLCACPLGFECSLIRPDVFISDVDHLAGKYCIKAGTAYTDPGQCGTVSGHFDQLKCEGTPAN